MDPNEPRWHLNTSFSPPPSRRFNPLNGSSRRVTEPVNYGSSLGSRSGQFGSERNHHHSVSDGALSYYGSPAESVPAARWTPSLQRFDLGEFSTPSGSARPETPYPHSTERQLTGTSSFGSASPMFPPPHNRFPGRRSFMSKPVYPLVFRNPVSSEPGSLAGPATPSEDSWPASSPDLKFHKALTQLQKHETSPDPNFDLRHGFRWSNASSFEEESVDIPMDLVTGLDSQRFVNPYPLRSQQKCGLCERMLWQKSPWSSARIMRNGDMPTCGVLPCCHVYHVDCLEENTPKGEDHDPPCPLCARPCNSNGSETVGSVSEPLRRSQTGGGRSRFLRKQFRSLRGRIGKELLGAGRVFKRVGSSSTNPRDDRGDLLEGEKREREKD